MLVSVSDGVNTGWACYTITRCVSFIAKLFNGNMVLLVITVSSNILTQPKNILGEPVLYM